jgi:hypothetical protein
VRESRAYLLILERLAGHVEVALAVVDGHEEVGEDEGDDRHELHEDVERGARGVLQGVARG